MLVPKDHFLQFSRFKTIQKQYEVGNFELRFYLKHADVKKGYLRKTYCHAYYCRKTKKNWIWLPDVFPSLLKNIFYQYSIGLSVYIELQ